MTVSEDDGQGGEAAAAPAAEPAGGPAGPGLAGVAKRQVVGDGLEVGGQLGGGLVAVAGSGSRQRRMTASSAAGISG